MAKKLTNNLGLKIVALLCAIVLWLIGININDPVSQTGYNVTVQLQNVTSLTSAGKYVEVAENSDKIRVTVRGTRSALTSFSNSDIIATADLTKITEDNRVPIELNTTKTSDNIESVKADSQYVLVNVENINKHQIPIEVKVQNEPGQGYILGPTTTAQNVVIVSGPESEIEKVKYAAVEINVDDATSDVKISLPIHLYDEDDSILDTSKITMSMSEVSTTATILQTKSLPIRCGVTGNILDGYAMTGEIDCSPSIITVAGKSSILKNISAIEISDAVDITGCDEDATADVNLKEYLPDGITIVDEEKESIAHVVVYIEKKQEATFSITSEKIHITNVPEGFSIDLMGREDLEVVATGLRETLNSIDENELVGVVDVAKYIKDTEIVLGAGEMEMPVAVTLPDGITLNDIYTVRVMVRKQ